MGTSYGSSLVVGAVCSDLPDTLTDKFEEDYDLLYEWANSEGLEVVSPWRDPEVEELVIGVTVDTCLAFSDEAFDIHLKKCQAVFYKAAGIEGTLICSVDVN